MQNCFTNGYSQSGWPIISNFKVSKATTCQLPICANNFLVNKYRNIGKVQDCNKKKERKKKKDPRPLNQPTPLCVHEHRRCLAMWIYVMYIFCSSLVKMRTWYLLSAFLTGNQF